MRVPLVARALAHSLARSRVVLNDWAIDRRTRMESVFGCFIVVTYLYLYLYEQLEIVIAMRYRCFRCWLVCHAPPFFFPCICLEKHGKPFSPPTNCIAQLRYDSYVQQPRARGPRASTGERKRGPGCKDNRRSAAVCVCVCDRTAEYGRFVRSGRLGERGAGGIVRTDRWQV